MAPRVQPQSNLIDRRVSIRPAASPVSRYTAPVQPTHRVGPSKASQVAEALSGFFPELNEFVEHELDRRDQEAIQQAIELRSKNAVQWKEAVNKGIVPLHSNPWFEKQWKTMDGSVLADEYNKDLLIALSSGPLANSTSQEESDKLLDAFKQNWRNEHVSDPDRDFIAGFDRKATAYEVQARNHQAAVVGNNMVAAAGEAFSQNMQGILDEVNTRGLSVGAVADAINDEKEKALFVGMDPKDVNALILEGVATEARSRLDISLFDVLGEIRTGTGTLGGTTNARKLREQVTNQIYSELRQRDDYEYTKDVRKRAEIVRTANAAIGARLIQDLQRGQPTTIESVQTELDAIIAQGEVSHAQSLVSAIIKTQKEPDRPENELVKNKLYIDTYAGREINFSRLTRHFEAQDINLPTYVNLMEEQLQTQHYNKSQEDSDDSKRDTLDPAFRESLSSLGRIAGGDLALNDFALQVSRAQAEAQFRRGARQWLAAHPEATEIEKIEASTKLLNSLVEQFRSQFGTFAGTVEEIIQGAPGVRSGQIQPIGLNSPAAAQPVQKHFKDALDWEAAVDEELATPGKSRLAQIARSLGLTVEQFVQQQDPLY